MWLIGDVLIVLFTSSVQELLRNYQKVVNSIPSIMQPLLKPFINQVDDVLIPGLTMLSWTSLNIDKCMKLLTNIKK